MSKIEIVSQPQENTNTGRRRSSVVEKLQELVEENAVDDPADDPVGGRPPSPTSEHSHKVTQNKDHKNDAIQTDEKSKGKKINKEYDHDGFEVPKGKIPLDGHFSSQEIKELVDVAKKEGFLKDDVDVRILEQNDLVGDKVAIVDNDRND